VALNASMISSQLPMTVPRSFGRFSSLPGMARRNVSIAITLTEHFMRSTSRPMSSPPSLPSYCHSPSPLAEALGRGGAVRTRINHPFGQARRNDL